MVLYYCVGGVDFYRGLAMTLRERYTRYLIDHGWRRDYTKPQSAKYHKYSHPSAAGWYFLGKAGGIRFNFDNNSTHSLSREYPTKAMMMRWEKEHGYTV